MAASAAVVPVTAAPAARAAVAAPVVPGAIRTSTWWERYPRWPAACAGAATARVPSAMESVRARRDTKTV